MASADEDLNIQEAPRKVYILGTGSIGKFVAHAIRGVAQPPPVTVLFHRIKYYHEFKEAENTLSITTSQTTEKQTGYEAELIYPGKEAGSDGFPVRPSSDFRQLMSAEPIDHLLVAVKATQTVSALKSVMHRLSASSTICFLQNGMGIVDEVNEEIWPDPEKRPNYIVGVNSHGVYATGVASAVHAGHGAIFLGIMPRKPFSAQERYEQSQSSEQAATPTKMNDSVLYLLRTLTRTPVLAAVSVSVTELLQSQLEKLCVNCIVNPLTVMLDCRNGDLLYNYALQRTWYLLLTEICVVIQALPELKGVPNVQTRFTPERMNQMVTQVAQATAENISSMLQDTRRGNQTEIEYINGYVVKRGEELGIKPVMNYMLMQMVKGKQAMISREIAGSVGWGNPPKYKL